MNNHWVESLLLKYDLKKYIFLQESNVKKQTELIQRYLAWASNHKSISLSNDEIPIGVLPNNRHVQILDLKIKVNRGKPDDELYDQDEELRKKLARGNSILHVIGGPQAGLYLVLFALRKFTSKEAFDDDDRQDSISSLPNHPSSDSWKLYFTKPIEEAVSVVCTDKANGESAHLSCLYLEEKLLIVAGSKNVHIAFTKTEHIDLYNGSRYRMAKEFCHSIMKMLNNLPDDKSNELLNFLAVTRFTAIFEILCPDHQHIENLSDLKKNHLKFITWTVNDFESTALTSLPPDISIDIAREFGLDCINYTKLPSNEEAIKQRIDQVRLSDGREGEVHYYLDSDSNTIGLAKIKSNWYILCRAIREKAKGALAAKLRYPDKYNPQSTKSKMEKRLRDIQSWLKFSNDVYEQWLTLSLQFISFLVNEQKFSLDELTNLFPLVWKRFLDQSGLTDRVIYTKSD